MRNLYLLIAIVLLSINGCTVPTAHLNTRYLTKPQVAEVSEVLEQLGYNIKHNQLPLPSTINSSTLIYSPNLSKQSKVLEALDKLRGLGWPVDNVDFFNQDGHWYSHDSFGLFLIPRVEEITTVESLTGEYLSAECESSVKLWLEANLAFEMQYKGEQITGRWRFVQFPYLQLYWPEDDYHREYYFSVSFVEQRDVVGEINITRLTPVNVESGVPSCTFEQGIRRG